MLLRQINHSFDLWPGLYRPEADEFGPVGRWLLVMTFSSLLAARWKRCNRVLVRLRGRPTRYWVDLTSGPVCRSGSMGMLFHRLRLSSLLICRSDFRLAGSLKSLRGYFCPLVWLGGTFRSK